MAKDILKIIGAREHNLKNVSLEIPRDKLIIFTGLSGSGKSSLAFDTIYAEGQRRYVESLSTYARQFLGQMEKPDIDYIEGLSPSISIDQKTTSRNPRSTVGTVTEIYDYLRLLYARVGIPHCPVCNKEIKQQTIDQIVDKVLGLPEGTRLMIMSPVIRARKGEHQKIFEDAQRSGFVRARVNGSIYELSEKIELDKNKKHNIEIVVDRIVMDPEIRQRLADSIEIASTLSGGLVMVEIIGDSDGTTSLPEEKEMLFSQKYACPEHDISIEDLSPRLFSFNNPYGACQACGGLGIQRKIDPDNIIPDKSLSIQGGAILASGWSKTDGGTISEMYFEGLANHYNFSLDTPVEKLPKKIIDIILYGTKGVKIKLERRGEYGTGSYTTEFEGIINNLQRRYKETNSEAMREYISNLMIDAKCPECDGARLRPEARAVTVGGISIHEFCRMSIADSATFAENLRLSERDFSIARQILKEIRARLGFLQSVGLSYLTLWRSAGTLSGGESQRIRLATQIGSSLVGVLYILDEPSIGLHQRDNDKLLKTLKHLRDIGNTVIVVEHDEETIQNADYIIDIGPGAGVHGGEVVFAGTLEEILACKQSVTGQYLSGARKIEIPKERRAGRGDYIIIRGASENNLKDIDVKIPLGTFTCITGVSGSGKSSLVNEILYKKLAAELNGARMTAGKHKSIEGIEYLDKVIDIDQSPIGRTPRSNPATYTGVFNDIRDLFASTTDAKIRGYSTGRFSFNVRGGRCEACQGDGIVRIEMHFLPDVYVPCEVCKGRRYNRETLDVHYKDKNIHDVLEMTVDEGITFFEAVPRIRRKLETLMDVGLGYIKIGQPSTTLSGGEAQRVKLATELSKRPTGKTVYILDEPTTGLHTADVHKLIDVLQKFVDSGNTVIIIEHNVDMIKSADYIIDLGPEGGDKGGEVIICGAPEEIIKAEASYTGQYLKKILRK